MNKHDNGGPAFPVTLQPGEMYKTHAEFDGMTLRDYFAAKAMQAIRSKSMPMDAVEVARRAYEQADAMLEARKS